MIFTEYLRYIQWPWALILAIVLPVAAAWLVTRGLRARRDRLARRHRVLRSDSVPME